MSMNLPASSAVKLPSTDPSNDNNNYQIERNKKPNFSLRQLNEVRREINSVNRSNKAGLGLNIFGLGVLSSFIGLDSSSNALDTSKELKETPSDLNLEKKLKEIKRTQRAIFRSDIASLFIIPSIVTIPLSMVLNGVNWRKTGKLKEKINDLKYSSNVIENN